MMNIANLERIWAIRRRRQGAGSSAGALRSPSQAAPGRLHGAGRMRFPAKST